MYRMLCWALALFAMGVVGVSGRSNASESFDLPMVRVYADLTPPIRTYDSEGRAVGELVDQVHDILDETGLRYEIILTPWMRAYSMAQSDPHALIFHLDRIPEREGQFYWIAKLDEVEYRVFTRNEPDMLALTLEEAVDGNHDILCERSSAQCEMALDLGFSEQRLVKYVDAASRTGGTMLMHRRADYFLTNAEILEKSLLNGTISADQIVPVFEPMRVSTWLAVHRNADSRLVKIMTDLVRQASIADDMPR